MAHESAPESADEFLSNLSRMLNRNAGNGSPPLEYSDVQSEACFGADMIYDNWRRLSEVLQRHEETIQARWDKMSKHKRREMLLAVWPGMNEKHRPDFAIHSKRSTDPIEQAFPYPVEGRPNREAFMMPYINLEDLCKLEPILLMLKSRGRMPPGAWAPHETAPLALGIHTGALVPFPIMAQRTPGRVYVLHFPAQNFRDGYGELAPVEPGEADNPNAPRPSQWVVPGIGLTIISIQKRVYDFLFKITLVILRDINPYDLLDPFYPIKPDPPWISAAAKRDRLTKLSDRNLNAHYMLPVLPELKRMARQAQFWKNGIQDMFDGLCRDPGYFLHSLKESLDHTPELFERQANGNLVQITTEDKNCDAFCEAIANFIVSILRDYEVWWHVSDLIQMLNSLNLDAVLSTGTLSSAGDDFEPQLEAVADAVDTARKKLGKTCDIYLNKLSKQVLWSPGIRCFNRLGPSGRDSASKGPISCRWFVDAPSHVDSFIGALDTLIRDWEFKRYNRAGVLPILADELDQFYTADSARAQKLVSASTARRASDVSSAVDVFRQLDLVMTCPFWKSSIAPLLGATRAKVDVAFLQREGKWVRLQASLKRTTARDFAKFVKERSYPAEQQRSKETVQIMQEAERELDELWTAVMDQAISSGLVDKDQVPSIRPPNPFPTPDWVEPSPKRQASIVQEEEHVHADDGEKVTPGSLPDSKNTTMNLPKKPSDFWSPSIKAIINPVNAGESLQEPTAAKIPVDDRSLVVFQTIFSVPHKPLSFEDVANAIRKVGFAVERPIGSAWLFTPRDPPSRWYSDGIVLHEPHPHTKLSSILVRDLARRLKTRFGWDSGSFALETQEAQEAQTGDV